MLTYMLMVGLPLTVTLALLRRSQVRWAPYAPPSRLGRAGWRREQEAIAERLLVSGRDLFPGAPESGLGREDLWPASTDPTAVVPNCGAYATEDRLGLRIGPGDFARPYRRDEAAKAVLDRTLARTRPREMRFLLERDGFVPLTLEGLRHPLQGWPVAAYVRPGEDYHFVRMDRDGGFTHKAGVTSVSQKVSPCGGTKERLEDLLRCGSPNGRYRLVGFYQVVPERLRQTEPL